MALTKDAILGMDDLPRQKVRVEEWDDDVYVRTLDGEQRQEFKELAAQHEKGEVSEIDMVALLVAATVTDEAGGLLFTPEDAPALRKKNANALITIGNVALSLNAMTGDDLEELQGNSQTSQS